MTDEDALLAAIVANPDDDTPRLVYADWLDEHDQATRAEFIRIQIERIRSAPDQSHYRELLRRESLLLCRHRKSWLGRIRKLLPRSDYEFRRGFVEDIETEAAAYLRSAAELHRTTPIRQVTVRDATDLCDLNLKNHPPRIRLRVIANEGSWTHPRTELDLLCRSPAELEPHVARGSWLVLAWAVWSGPDRVTVSRLGRALVARHWPVSVGIRPFDNSAEFGSWCPPNNRLTGPLWLRLLDGRLVWEHVGTNPPDEFREYWPQP